MEIRLKTLTPLWTGGVSQTCDRLHETGIIGSLRWWYETLVRGLGGYVCDPTSENPDVRCSFDSKAYEKAKAQGRSDAEAIHVGLKTVCPVCYLFGATGWARLFQLRAIDVPMTPMHFRTTLFINQGWLKRMFGGEKRNIDLLHVPYGDLSFQFTTRRYDEDFARSQFALALRVAAEYGGVGARLQHGFGQVKAVLPPELNAISIDEGLAQLATKIRSGLMRSNGPTVETTFDLKNLVRLTYHVPQDKLSAFMQSNAHVGSERKKGETEYIPCAFDLHYKGSGKWGMRQWLKQKGWKESNDPKKLEELDLLLGPRSQWGPKGKEKKINEDLHTASRVFFSMPHRKDQDTYVLHVWAFLPFCVKRQLPTVQDLRDLCSQYFQYVLGVEPISVKFGQDILAQARGV